MLKQRIISVGLRGLSLFSLMYVCAPASAGGPRCPWSFADSVSYEAGPWPNAVATGDLNGDGRCDLVAAISSWGRVAVLLGNGEGTFQGPALYGATDGAGAVAVGDLNGDGRLDLVATIRYGIAVFLGNGDGTFQAEVDLPAGDANFQPRSVAISDLNADGHLDLVLGGGNASVLLGIGDGTFVPAVMVDSDTSFTWSVAIDDLNGDRRPDVALANNWYWGMYISVLFGNGDGTFGPPLHLDTGVSPRSVAIGDLNGDGYPDIVSANERSENISVLLNLGNGIFATSVNYASYGPAWSLAIGEVTGDGRLDVVVASEFIAISVFTGNGDGTFSDPRNYTPGARSVVMADLDRDGLLDLAGAYSEDVGVAVLLNTGCPPDFDCDGFVTGVDFDLFVQAFEAGDLLADFNNDGFLTGEDFDLYVQAFEAGC